MIATLVPVILQVVVYLGLLALITRFLGIYMVQVFEGPRNFLSTFVRPVENGIYRLFRIEPERQQNWVAYASAMLAFNVIGLLLTYLILRIQQWLPLNPMNFGPTSDHLA